MMRFVVVATLQRGMLAEPEPLDAANQWRALEAADAATAAEIEILRARATRHVQAERDPDVSAKEMDRLTRGGANRERIEHMMRLAERKAS